MRRIFSILAATAVLAACSDSGTADTDGDGTISSEEIAAEARDAVRPDPGQYRSTTQLVDVEMPGAPPEMVDMMRANMSNRTSEFCLTEEEVNEGFEAMAKRSQDGDCTFSKFDVDGGDIDAEMSCSMPQGSDMRMTMQGTGTPTSSDMTMTMEGELPGMGNAKMTMKVTNERIGDCT